jgi:hypothetical protein
MTDLDDLRKRVEYELPHHLAVSSTAVLISDLWRAVQIFDAREMERVRNALEPVTAEELAKLLIAFHEPMMAQAIAAHLLAPSHIGPLYRQRKP